MDVPQKAPEFDVFVSYRWVEPDLSWVRNELVPALRSAGLRVCLDVNDFIPGRDLILEMTRAGQTSRRAICVLSDDYVAGNRMVHFESLAARRRDPSGSDSCLIPLIFRPTTLPEWFRGLIPVDWTDPKNHGREWEKLLKVLGAPILSPPPSRSTFEIGPQLNPLANQPLSSLDHEDTNSNVGAHSVDNERQESKQIEFASKPAAEWITIQEATEVFIVSTTTLRRRLKNGSLSGQVVNRNGRRVQVVRESELRTLFFIRQATTDNFERSPTQTLGIPILSAAIGAIIVEFFKWLRTIISDGKNADEETLIRRYDEQYPDSDETAKQNLDRILTIQGATTGGLLSNTEYKAFSNECRQTLEKARKALMNYEAARKDWIDLKNATDSFVAAAQSHRKLAIALSEAHNSLTKTFEERYAKAKSRREVRDVNAWFDSSLKRNVTELKQLSDEKTRIDIECKRLQARSSELIRVIKGLQEDNNAIKGTLVKLSRNKMVDYLPPRLRQQLNATLNDCRQTDYSMLEIYDFLLMVRSI